MMELEKEKGQFKWFREHELKIKCKNLGETSELWVTWNQHNIALTLIMFDFVAQIKRDIMLDVSIQKDLNQQRVFMVNSIDTLELVVYLFEFIREWKIQPSGDAISTSNIIPDELWYEF